MCPPQTTRPNNVTSCNFCRQADHYKNVRTRSSRTASGSILRQKYVLAIKDSDQTRSDADIGYSDDESPVYFSSNHNVVKYSSHMRIDLWHTLKEKNIMTQSQMDNFTDTNARIIWIWIVGYNFYNMGHIITKFGVTISIYIYIYIYIYIFK